MRRTIGLSVLMVLLLACQALASRLTVPTTTPFPAPSDTAMPTLTPSLSASSTPAPTDTPAPSPTLSDEAALALTLTAWPSVLSPGTSVPRQLDCLLKWQSPGNGITYDSGEIFTVGWNVTNTGSTTWTPSTVEFTYVSGAKFSADAPQHLESSVSPGQSIILSVRMKAPRNSTLYTTYWSLRSGSTYFCPVSLTIYVD